MYNCDYSYPIVTNCILWNDAADEIYDDNSVPTVTYSCIQGGYPGTGNIDADPLFADSATDDFHLTWDSPCRNTGDNSAVTEPTDFEGDPRIALGTVDMGADEFYYHLYHTGDVFPGFPIEIKVVGDPNMPVVLCMGSGIQDPPIHTQYGDLYIWPIANQWLLGNIPGTGVLTFPTNVPASSIPGEYPFQALVGPLGSPHSVLTNLMELEIKPIIVYIPDDKATIQEAIDFLPDSGVVMVRPGTYVENINFYGKAITVTSEGGAAVTVIDGNQTGPAVLFKSGEDENSVLNGFTLTNGSGYGGSGGGIYCKDSSPTITNNMILGNTAGQGGGIACDGVHYDSSPTITSNIISGNTAEFGLGGGIYCHSSWSTITNNTISENSAIGYNWGSGGGIYCIGSYPTIINNIIQGNKASANSGQGGGFYFNKSYPIITNNTISGNMASDEGGGIYANGDLTITNTILWDNSAPSGSQIAGGSTLKVTYCDVQGGWPGTGNIDADPLFVDPGAGDFHITVDSPCLDAGDNNVPSLPILDFEGDPRIFPGNGKGVYLVGSPPPGAIVDMGADEYCLLKRQQFIPK
jgi:parallel beta-helix repeat protein/predicted outer membrane repeat protein